jgi:hypothetical protein
MCRQLVVTNLELETILLTAESNELHIISIYSNTIVWPKTLCSRLLRQLLGPVFHFNSFAVVRDRVSGGVVGFKCFPSLQNYCRFECNRDLRSKKGSNYRKTLTYCKLFSTKLLSSYRRLSSIGFVSYLVRKPTVSSHKPEFAFVTQIVRNNLYF